MKFKFIGNGKEDPPFNKSWGITFPFGVPVEVKDEGIIKKLKGNSHFEHVPLKAKNGYKSKTSN